LPFGAYVQVHVGRTGNLQGTHKFYSLRTGEVIVHGRWTELPIPSEVIKKLTEMIGNQDEVLNKIEDENEEVLEKELEENSLEEEGKEEMMEDRDFPEERESLRNPRFKICEAGVMYLKCVRHFTVL
jgi:hypothetical protein